ncbi:prepilin-type N-terminal cleavage/methylation domain-containing protein [Phycisphaeraceae bacterium D3-23]
MTMQIARHCRAFSMVEMMITVTILGIIGALAAPMLSPNATTKLRSAATVLAADLDACRADSIAHGEDPRLIVFDTVAEAYHIAASSDPDTPLPHPTSGGDYTVTFGSADTAQLNGVTIQSVSVGGDDQLGFEIYGQLDQAANATITLEADGVTITLTLDAATGEVTIGELQ